MTKASPDGGVPAVFLDRDGTIMRDVDYCGDPKQVEVFAGASAALRRLKENGYKLIVITNQSGIGRGYFTEERYRSVAAELTRQVGANVIDATYFCPDKPGREPTCRKPSPEMVLRAAADHQVNLARSFFVGDKSVDVECGRNAGVQTILVQTGSGAGERGCAPDWIARDIGEAAEVILTNPG